MNVEVVSNKIIDGYYLTGKQSGFDLSIAFTPGRIFLVGLGREMTLAANCFINVAFGVLSL